MSRRDVTATIRARRTVEAALYTPLNDVHAERRAKLAETLRQPSAVRAALRVLTRSGIPRHEALRSLGVTQ